METPESPVRSRYERRNAAGRRDLVQRFRLEYQQLPGMSLTAAQAARLFALRPDICLRIFDELVQSGMLRRTVEAQYVWRRPFGAR